MTKVIIVNYNRLNYLKYTVDWCMSHGLEPIVVDNKSNYQPLIDYYNTNPCYVLRLDNNWGHTVVWNTNVLSILGILNERYIVTDPDLTYDGIPDDFLEVLNKGLDKYPEIVKCAFSLEINDLPDTEEGNLIRSVYEKKYWESPLDDMYFYADTDTTFALYREGANKYTHSAIRTNRPYTARHLSWYYKNFKNLDIDEQNYYITANSSSSGKNRLLK